MAKALSDAIEKGDLETVTKLIGEGVDINFCSVKDEFPFMPLHTAVYFDRLDCLKLLLEQDSIKLDAVNSELIHHEFGDAQGSGLIVLRAMTPLQIASFVSETSLEVFQSLIDAGCDINLYDPISVTAPLHLACITSQVEKVKCLVEAGADVNKVNFCGMTALHIAAEQGLFEVVNILLDSGAQVNLKDERGYEPVTLAFMKNLYDVVEILLPLTDLNIQDVINLGVGSDDGVIEFDFKMIKLLIEHAQNKNEMSPDLFSKILYNYRFSSEEERFYSVEFILQTELLALKSPSTKQTNWCDSFLCCKKYSVPCQQYCTKRVGLLLDFFDLCAEAGNTLWPRYESLFYLLFSENQILETKDYLLYKISSTVLISDFKSKIFSLLDMLVMKGLNLDYRKYSAVPFIFESYYPSDSLEAIFISISFCISIEPFQIDEYYMEEAFYDEGDMFSLSTLDSRFKPKSISCNLEELCRFKIRECLRKNCKNTKDFLIAIKSFQIPTFLQDFIRYKY